MGKGITRMSESKDEDYKDFQNVVAALAQMISAPGQSHAEASLAHLTAAITSLRLLSEHTENECMEDILGRVVFHFKTFGKDECSFILQVAADHANARSLEKWKPGNSH